MEEISLKVMSTIKTHRQKIYDISRGLYKYYMRHLCRKKLQGLFDLIILEFLSKDQEMIAFIEMCENDSDGMIDNYWFMTVNQVNNIWPNLNIITEDDYNKELVNKVDEFINVIPVIDKYKEYFVL